MLDLSSFKDFCVFLSVDGNAVMVISLYQAVCWCLSVAQRLPKKTLVIYMYQLRHFCEVNRVNRGTVRHCLFVL